MLRLDDEAGGVDEGDMNEEAGDAGDEDEPDDMDDDVYSLCE